MIVPEVGVQHGPTIVGDIGASEGECERKKERKRERESERERESTPNDLGHGTSIGFLVRYVQWKDLVIGLYHIRLLLIN